MARITPDGNSKFWWVTTIAAVTAPTLVEIEAGIELTPFVAPAGFDFPEEGTDADTSDLSSARDKSVPATTGGAIEGEFYNDDGTGGTADDAWDAIPRNTDGYLVVAPYGGLGTDKAIAVADTVEVWKVRVGSRSRSRYTRGEAIRFTGTFSLSADPELAATVA